MVVGLILSTTLAQMCCLMEEWNRERTPGRSCDAAPPSSGVRRSYLMMNVFPISIKTIREMTSYKICRGVVLYKSFAQVRNTRSSWRTERDTVGLLQLLRVVFVGNRKRRFSMFCPIAGKWLVTALEGGSIRPRTKSSGAVIELP
ncbi:hypothetical protein PoB_004539300 [Plakobranchus ocellatus]|uniref:Secreted protein n=1 Tax=Plakobranchus ocellatus TaxID=259542 RepID=A0AAV4BI83_9GAST|nr:hypothetical protein PoB_004539300 [Plakobranchus ocellatus]